MDPIENLREQRALSAEIVELSDLEQDEATQSRIAEHGQRLAVLVQELDEWMKKGGFSPWTSNE